MSKIPANKGDEIRKWLHSIDTNNAQDVELSDVEESCSSVVDSSIIETSSSESGEELALGERRDDTTVSAYNGDILPHIPAISFNNVNISNSSNIYMGNIYSVKGSLNINVINSDSKLQEEPEPTPKKSTVIRHVCQIFPRYRWLAMDPLSENNKIPEPVEFVAVAFTATISSTIQARNIGIIRDYQTLNVEAQGYNDIIYNFLVGCDGWIYEGRGWGVEGDHTDGYNHNSIGIAFVGNFKRELPTERALKACQNLITRGITEGHLLKDYKVFTTVQSPVLCKELKKWNNFYNIENNNES